MNINSLKSFIEKAWDDSALPSLMEYVAVPALSPAYDSEWYENSYLNDTIELASKWCETISLENAKTHILTPRGRTPLLLIDVAATQPEDGSNVLLYGHLDKQPGASGWDHNKGPWTPVIENDRIYGRGTVDDGYAFYTYIVALKALQMEKIPHPRCLIFIETCEESGSPDLDYYLAHCEQIIGEPDLIVCLDSGGFDHDRLWITNSLRGIVSGNLETRILNQSIHSGSSGAVASSFRIMREILDRIEDAKTGEILINEFYASIPEYIIAQINEVIRLTGDSIRDHIPLYKNAGPMGDNPLELIINSTWKPFLSYTGMDGIPDVSSAANVVREYTRLKLSFRTPPTVDTALPLEKLKQTIEFDPPYNAGVSFTQVKNDNGWSMPQMGVALENSIAVASETCFGQPACYTGDGGTIPFVTLFSDKFPDSRMLVTGALCPDSNAHGPNEFLRIGYVKKITMAIAMVIATMKLNVA